MTKIITTSTYDGHPLIGKNIELDYNPQYRQKNKELLDHTIGRHNKVMAVRADLRYPAAYDKQPTNKDISTAMRTFTRALSRKWFDPQYIVKKRATNIGTSSLALCCSCRWFESPKV